MSHEQSETMQGRDKRWYNIYGQGTGATQPMPLPRLFGFEQDSYPTEEMASNRAAWRSQLGEGHYPTQPPQYGFTNTYEPSPQAKALGKVIEALQDPRNAWIGMGALRGLGPLRGRLFQPRGPESGGFNVPTTQMRRDLGIPRPNLPKMEVPSTEKAIRSDYLGTVAGLNQDAQLFMRGQPYLQQARELYDLSNPARQEAINRTLVGRQALANEMQHRLFGFGNTAN